MRGEVRGKAKETRIPSCFNKLGKAAPTEGLKKEAVWSESRFPESSHDEMFGLQLAQSRFSDHIEICPANITYDFL